MTKHFFISLSFFLISTFSATAQNATKIDSLRVIINDNQADSSTRLIAFRDVIIGTLYNNHNNSFDDLNKYLSMSIKFNNGIRIAHAHHCFNYYYRTINNVEKAESHALKELNIAKGINNPYYILNAQIDLALVKGVNDTESALIVYQYVIDSSIVWKEPVIEARARINLGELHKTKGDYLIAINELQSALDLCEQKDIIGFMASTLISLGDVNLEIEQFVAAKKHYLKAIEWSESRNNRNTKITALQKYAELEFKQKKYIKSDSIIQVCIELTQNINATKSLPSSYYLLAKSALLQGKKNKSENYVKLGLQYSDSNDLSLDFANLRSMEGFLSLDKGKYNEAIAPCFNSYTLHTTLKNIKGIEEACDCLYKAYKQTNQIDSALLYHEKYLTANLKLRNLDEVKKVVIFQKNLEFNLAELKHAKKNEQQNYLILLIGLVAFLTALFSFFIYRSLSKNKKQKIALEKLDYLNKQIFSIISHDFKEPLMGLETLAEGLDKFNIKDERLAFYTEDIKHQISKTTNILDNLLNWAKAELNQDFTTQPQSNIFTITEEILALFSEKILKKELVISNLLTKDKYVTIHPDLLRIVLRNIISNAIKYSYNGGAIEVTMSNTEIIIKDNGVGINTDNKKILLTKPVFSELGTSHESGFGIGLFITNQLLHKINWSISFRTPKTKNGTEVVLTYNKSF